jgi:serine protease SohB
MLNAFVLLLLFTVKAIIVVALILILLVGIIAISTKGKEKLRGRITIKNLNEKYKDVKEILLAEVLNKDQMKKFTKAQKAADKEKKKTKNSDAVSDKNVYVVNFCGDIKASAVTALREEISAILSVAKRDDEVVVRLESPGGMVHAYGLAAAQLSRVREKQIPLTITVDKVAASGGYLMACVANKILAAPFAIIGSIGVIVQMPNFHRLLEDKHIDFEQLTAGDYKRTLTVFGKNTEEDREKLKEEIEVIHDIFKQSILQYRPDLDMKKVATGEHWLAVQAKTLGLVDEILTSDDYLQTLSANANLYEVIFETKKPLASKLTAAANLFLKREDYSTVLLK